MNIIKVTFIVKLRNCNFEKNMISIYLKKLLKHRANGEMNYKKLEILELDLLISRALELIAL